MMDRAANAAQSAKDSLQEVCPLILFHYIYTTCKVIFFQRFIRTKNNVFVLLLIILQAGQQMQAKAQGAADAVKNATGLNK